MSGMRGAGGGGGGRGRVSGGDAAAQKALNAAAPKIPNLLRRIGGLFAGHKAAIIMTMVLVLIGAALSVVPPLLTQRAFDD
jgi:ATP-binding cassette subfamily B protein